MSKILHTSCCLVETEDNVTNEHRRTKLPIFSVSVLFENRRLQSFRVHADLEDNTQLKFLEIKSQWKDLNGFEFN